MLTSTPSCQPVLGRLSSGCPQKSRYTRRSVGETSGTQHTVVDVGGGAPDGTTAISWILNPVLPPVRRQWVGEAWAMVNAG